LVKTHFRLTIIFCLPGNLNLTLLRASCAWFPFAYRKQNLPNHNPCTSPMGLFPKASFMLVWSLFAPAQEGILLMRKTGMKGMHSSLKMETIVSYIISHIPVARNACSFKGFTLHIFFVPRNKMYTDGKFINTSLFSYPHINSDLWIRKSSAIPCLGVGLIFNLPAQRRSSNHGTFLLS